MVHKYKRKAPEKPPIGEKLWETAIDQIKGNEIPLSQGAKQLKMPESTLFASGARVGACESAFACVRACRPTRMLRGTGGCYYVCVKDTH